MYKPKTQTNSEFILSLCMEGQMNRPKYVIRDGKKYKVHTIINDKEIMVKKWFKFSKFPYYKKLKLWWTLDGCEKVIRQYYEYLLLAGESPIWSPYELEMALFNDIDLMLMSFEVSGASQWDIEMRQLYRETYYEKEIKDGGIPAVEICILSPFILSIVRHMYILPMFKFFIQRVISLKENRISGLGA